MELEHSPLETNTFKLFFEMRYKFTNWAYWDFVGFDRNSASFDNLKIDSGVMISFAPPLHSLALKWTLPPLVLGLL